MSSGVLAGATGANIRRLSVKVSAPCTEAGLCSSVCRRAVLFYVSQHFDVRRVVVTVFLVVCRLSDCTSREHITFVINSINTQNSTPYHIAHYTKPHITTNYTQPKKNSTMASPLHYGGIEGGGTHSKIILCTADGRIVANITGPATNHWIIGIPECAARIGAMVADAKRSAGLDERLPLRALGLSLSGCEQELSNRQLEAECRQRFPEAAEHYVVCSDTLGSVATASAAGGMVLIAGTGSNALLRNPDGRTYTCGGWGHMLGDEGGAWWISHRAVKTVFDHFDRMHRCVHDVQPVWRLIREHFGVDTQADLLAHCYANFEKPRYAGLCERLAEQAAAGDALCVQLFRDAGEALARATVALLPRVSDDLVRAGQGALQVVCVGSVWNSWPLLRDGFIGGIMSWQTNSDSLRYDLRLLQLTQHMALGAVYMAVDSVEDTVPRRYEDNYRVFHVVEWRKRDVTVDGDCDADGVMEAANGKP